MNNSTVKAQLEVLARVRAAAKKYRSAYAAHRNNPRDSQALEAWDVATAKFDAMIANDELNIIASLLEVLDVRDRQIADMQAKEINVKRQAQALFEAIQTPDDAYIPAYVRCLRNALAGVMGASK